MRQERPDASALSNFEINKKGGEEAVQRNDLIRLLRVSIGGAASETEAIDYPKSIELALAHCVGNMLYYAAMRLPAQLQPDADCMQKLKQIAYRATMRDAMQDQELKRMDERFRANGIKAVHLKGCEIKKLYPNPAMRFMSDTDLLICPEQAKAVRGIMTELGFSVFRYDQDDTDIYSGPTGMNYEIHKSLISESHNTHTKLFTEKMISFAQESEGRWIMPNEEHFAYLLCHFVKHLIKGGIGVRQVLDIHLCRTKWKFDDHKLKKLLRELELSEFDKRLQKLEQWWFADGKPDALTQELEEYILLSGVFGNEDHRILNRLIVKNDDGGRLRYYFKRIFPPYSKMRKYFPAVNKCPILLPFFWVWRIIRGIFFRNKNLQHELDTLQKTDDSKINARAEFFKRCGLELNKKKG